MKILLTLILFSCFILSDKILKAEEKIVNPVLIHTANSHINGVEWIVQWSAIHAIAAIPEHKETAKVIYLGGAFRVNEQLDEDGTLFYCDEISSGDVISLVGPYLSYHLKNYSSCVGAAHGSEHRMFSTIDIRTGKRVNLINLFGETAIFQALLSDKFIRKTLGNRKPTNLSELFRKADGGCQAKIDDTSLTAFAFHHIKDDSVAIRIAFPHGCEAARGNLTQIGIYLKIAPELKEYLHYANENDYLMESLFNK